MREILSKTYNNRRLKFEKALLKAKRQSDHLVLFRSLIALLVIGLFIYGFYAKIPLIVLLAVPLIGLFFILVVKHLQTKNQIRYLLNIVRINKNALLRLSGKWPDFPHSGDRFIDPEHPFSVDLSIFGRGSLFQYLNTTTSFMGEQRLANLLSAQTDFAGILPRQQAIQDLSQRLEWRQHFQATGMDNVGQTRDPAKLLAWAEGEPILAKSKYKYLLVFLPALTLSLLTLTVFGFVPVYVPMVTLGLQLLMVIFSEKVVRQAFSATEKAIAELERYSALLKCIEQEEFQAKLLVDLKRQLLSQGHTSANRIKVLARLADRITLRYSPVIHFFLNIITFWDLHTLKKLEAWKNHSGLSMRRWLNVIGDFEAYSSLAILAHDNPKWAFPEVMDYQPSFEAAGLGHPLIHEDSRVCNNVSY